MVAVINYVMIQIKAAVALVVATVKVVVQVADQDKVAEPVKAAGPVKVVDIEIDPSADAKLKQFFTGVQLAAKGGLHENSNTRKQ